MSRSPPRLLLPEHHHRAETGRVMWSPPEAEEPLTIDLPELFKAI